MEFLSVNEVTLNCKPFTVEGGSLPVGERCPRVRISLADISGEGHGQVSYPIYWTVHSGSLTVMGLKNSRYSVSILPSSNGNGDDALGVSRTFYESKTYDLAIVEQIEWSITLERLPR